MKLKNFQKVVEETLEKYRETRNDDTLLTWYIIHLYRPECCSEHNGKYWVDYQGMKLVREDQVKRIRAKLNAEGKYLPFDPAVRRQRKISEQKWLEYLGYAK